MSTSMMRPKLMMALVIASASLAGCAQRSAERSPRSFEEQYAALNDVRAVTPAEPVAAGRRIVPALPVALGRVQGVVEHDVGEARSIRIGLDLKGASVDANYIEARSAPTSAILMRSESKPTETAILDELDHAFPGIQMHVVTSERRNAFGPYGLALGVGPDGERCAYAWQWIEASRSAPARSVALRSRLCTRALSLDALVHNLDQLSLKVVDIRTGPARSRRRRMAARRAAPTNAAPSGTRPYASPVLTDSRRYIVPLDSPDRVQEPAASPSYGSAIPATTPPSIALPPEAFRGPSRPVGQPSLPANAAAAPRAPANS